MSRSYYLDDMILRDGQAVLCKTSLLPLGITDGKIYHIVKRDFGSRNFLATGIINDNGDWVIPSARFQHVNKVLELSET